MMHASPDEQTVFGYLSILESPEHGYFGGYLLLSALGRPLEFHCTAPVRPSRAQEILYGPTLRSYLIGEQISGTLLGAAKLIPRLILTDQREVTFPRPPSDVPIILVVSRQQCENTKNGDESINDTASTPWRPADNSMMSWSNSLAGFSYEIRLRSTSEPQRDAIEQLLSMLAERVDLAEPFGRIHEAIREAQRIGGRAADETGQAA
jgi:hypothetical protein